MKGIKKVMFVVAAFMIATVVTPIVMAGSGTGSFGANVDMEAPTPVCNPTLGITNSPALDFGTIHPGDTKTASTALTLTETPDPTSGCGITPISVSLITYNIAPWSNDPSVTMTTTSNDPNKYPVTIDSTNNPVTLTATDFTLVTTSLTPLGTHTTTVTVTATF